MSDRCRWLLCLCVLAVSGMSWGCFDDNKPAEGLREAPQTGGPTVVFDLDAWPFPDIPFPNDVATRSDPTSPTNKRINVSMLGATDAESKVRRYINRLSGWGTYTPITVEFDAPLDIEHIIERHHEPVPDLSDDVVYVVNVDPDSDEFGKLELIDMGRGNFPLTLTRPDGYFANDPRSTGTNLLFETATEGEFGDDGPIDPMLDTDDDGVRDQPNTRTPGGEPYEPGELLTFYERETNTLVLRTLSPLAPKTTYAVVLTNELRGEDGTPVQSPFETINHTRHSEALEPLRRILPSHYPERFSQSLSEVQFAWTFTTGTPTREMEAIRAGLYGSGSLGWLADQFPAELKLLHAPKGPEADSPLTFNLERLISVIAPVAADALGSGGDMVVLEEAIGEIDYMISGSYISPYFLSDSDGLAEPGADASLKATNPQDDDEVFDIDLAEGTARVKPGEVTFHCAVPAAQPGREPPYPVIIYSHAISSTRLEMIAFAGHMAKFGLATCTIDAAGHGLDLPSGIGDVLERSTESVGLPHLMAMLSHDRARDLDNDGQIESGEDYFVSDILHSRDMMRQTAIDQMQLIRILRSFDGQSRWSDDIDTDDPWVSARNELVAGWDNSGDGRGEIRGDFNGDGVVDFGGERPYVAWGTSLGGLQTGLLAGIEPTVRAAVSNGGGGGLGDIATRTDIRNVRVGVFLPMFGPLLVGTAPTDDGDISGPMVLEWIAPSGISDERVPFASVDGVENGDTIVLRNLEREQRDFIPHEERDARVRVREGRFRVGIAADGDSGTSRRAQLGFDANVNVEVDLMGCVEGADCGDGFCDSGSYCVDGQTCRPIGECVPAFVLDEVDDSERRDALATQTAVAPTEFGDGLVIEIRDADGELKQTIDTFEQNVVFENILYPAGAPLAALHTGWGLQRQTPRFRKFLGVSQMLLEAADPAVYARHYFRDPLEFGYEVDEFVDGWTNFLVVPTIGDQTVPVNTGVSHARAAGIVGTHAEVDEYGTTENRFLVDNYVYEGIWWLDRFPDYPDTLFDPDDLDGGAFVSPRDAQNEDPNPDAEHPLRATVRTEHGISAMRLPYLDTRGEHTFNVANTERGFSIATFMTNQVGWYLAHGGRQLSDDPCLQDLFMQGCSFFDVDSFEHPALP